MNKMGILVGDILHFVHPAFLFFWYLCDIPYPPSVSGSVNPIPDPKRLVTDNRSTPAAFQNYSQSLVEGWVRDPSQSNRFNPDTPIGIIRNKNLSLC